MAETPDKSSSSLSTESLQVAFVFAAMELTKDVSGFKKAEDIATSYQTIYKAVVDAYNKRNA